MRVRGGICKFLQGSVLAVRWNCKNLQITNYYEVYKTYFINPLLGQSQINNVYNGCQIKLQHTLDLPII